MMRVDPGPTPVTSVEELLPGSTSVPVPVMVAVLDTEGTAGWPSRTTRAIEPA